MQGRSILVVEDDQSVQELVALSLSDVGEVKQATTGAEGLRIARGEPVVAVVLDYRLPDCSGLELLREIRIARPCLPVIMMTGFGSESVCASAFKLGIRDYFAKPFDVFAFRDSMRHILLADREQEDPGFGDRSKLRLPEPSEQRDMAIQKVAMLIQQRYWDHLTLPNLAREVGVSKHRLSRRFREVMGITLRGYLLRVRLEKAKLALASSSASVTEVALAVGYGDLPRFDKLFKRYTGVTPRAYRLQVHRST